jgi:O-antigen ligase
VFFFYLLISIMPLVKHPVWEYVLQGGLTVVKLIGAACVLYALVYLLVRPSVPEFFQTRQARLFVLFWAVATVSYFTKGTSAGWDVSPFVSYTSFLILFFVTVIVVSSLSRLRWSVLVAIGSLAFASLYVLREWQKHSGGSEGWRPGWVVGDSNYFTVSAILALSVGLYLAVDRQRPRMERVYCSICFVVTFAAVILAASRGGFLGLVSAFLLGIYRSRRPMRNLLLTTFLSVPLILIAPSSPVHRIMYPSRSDQQSNQLHRILWKTGLHMVEKHPLTGVGLGRFKPVEDQYWEVPLSRLFIAHNAYVEIAAEMGLPAILLFLAILFYSYQSFEKVRRMALSFRIPLLDRLALGLEVGLVGSSVSLFFVSGQYQKLLWFVIFLSTVVPQLARSLVAGARAVAPQAP